MNSCMPCSLLRKFGALDEDVARQYIAETVLALEYCHTQVGARCSSLSCRWATHGKSSLSAERGTSMSCWEEQLQGPEGYNAACSHERIGTAS